MNEHRPNPAAPGEPLTQSDAPAPAAPQLTAKSPFEVLADAVERATQLDEGDAAAEAPAIAPGPGPDDDAPEADSATSTGPTDQAAPAAHAIGVLIVNLGTPDAPEPKAVRRYLKQFLTDPRVIEKNSLVWRAVLNGVILPLRSRRKARDYRKIWNDETNESPFKTITRAQAERLAGIFEPLGEKIVVDWAMRYAEPSIASRLEALLARGCDRILVMPLYPQYSAATTATVCDEVFRYVMRLRRQPALRFMPAYYDDPAYIESVVSSLKTELQKLSFSPDVIVSSYHGMPKDYVLKGDPYESQCIRTTELLREQLGLDEGKLMLTYQSRFGRTPWLEPSTIATMKTLAKQGVKNLAVVTPGFSADCLETLEEIAVDNAKQFKRYGGKNFAAIPCLNDSVPGMRLLWHLAMRELKGWL
jgi:ferrochelatase